ncbi:hypothetical protein [Paraburkholderia tropica]|uniref:hypothetical protein n=1 Tax=Paraburkholderia tropica TaxID=92647 RepID=UPI003D2D862F
MEQQTSSGVQAIATKAPTSKAKNQRFELVVDEQTHQKILAKFVQSGDENLSHFIRRMMRKEMSLTPEVVHRVRSSINAVGQKVNQLAKQLHMKEVIDVMALEDMKHYKLEVETIDILLQNWMHDTGLFTQRMFSNVSEAPAVLNVSGVEDWTEEKLPKVRMMLRIDGDTKANLKQKMQAWEYRNMTQFVKRLLLEDGNLYAPSFGKVIYEISMVVRNIDQMKRHTNLKNPIHIMLVGEGELIKKALNDLLITLEQLRKI